MSEPVMPHDLNVYIQQKVAQGDFQSRDEFFVAAATVYRDMEERHEQLKHDIAIALEEAEAGLDVPFDVESIESELRKRFEQRTPQL